VKYNGQSSVGDFLERVEELRISRGLSKASLLRAAPELFSGDALLWYRTQRFVSWDDLTYQLREAFQPYDYVDSLWDEIRRRTQGSQEKVFSYIVAMENLFRKLPESPSAETKLHIVRRNLLPYLQSRLAVHNISSLAELLRLGRAIEETEVRIQRFAPPPIHQSSPALGTRTCLSESTTSFYDSDRFLTLFRLLDSGPSRTILGSPGWAMLNALCSIQPSRRVDCMVANRQTREVLGTVQLPIRLKERVILLDTLVLPDLPHVLILGVDFWTKMRIIPDLYSGE